MSLVDFDVKHHITWEVSFLTFLKKKKRCITLVYNIVWKVLLLTWEEFFNGHTFSVTKYRFSMTFKTKSQQNMASNAKYLMFQFCRRGALNYDTGRLQLYLKDMEEPFQFLDITSLPIRFLLPSLKLATLYPSWNPWHHIWCPSTIREDS